MGMEPDAVVQLLLKERVRVVAAATAIVRDVHAADDLFQQVVLAALEHRSSIKGTDHLLAWALRTARHRAIDLARRKQLRPLSTEVLDLIEAEWGDPAGVGAPEQVEALRRCVNRLGTPARDLLHMKYFEGLTAITIAGRLRRTADAVYQSLSRLHRSLRDCVEREMTRPPVPGFEGNRS